MGHYALKGTNNVDRHKAFKHWIYVLAAYVQFMLINYKTKKSYVKVSKPSKFSDPADVKTTHLFPFK